MPLISFPKYELRLTGERGHALIETCPACERVWWLAVPVTMEMRCSCGRTLATPQEST